MPISAVPPSKEMTHIREHEFESRYQYNNFISG